MVDFFGTDQNKQDLLKWASMDSHFKGIVSLCEKYAGKDDKSDLVRNLSVLGIKDQEVLDNLFSVVFENKELGVSKQKIKK